jgi:hypothetical protein
MKTKSAGELLAVASRIPTPVATEPLAKAETEVRRAVEEISTHLREIEEFGHTVKDGKVVRTDITDAYARGARNNIEEIYLKNIRTQINNVPKENRAALKEYIQNYVKNVSGAAGGFRRVHEGTAVAGAPAAETSVVLAADRCPRIMMLEHELPRG